MNSEEIDPESVTHDDKDGKQEVCSKHLLFYYVFKSSVNCNIRENSNADGDVCGKFLEV